MGGRSRRKGKVGERELAAAFREHGFTAHRGQQFQGGPGSQGVVVEELPWLHVECKRTERLKLYEAMDQSRCDAGAEQLPMVAYRANHRGWLAIMELGDFLRLAKEVGFTAERRVFATGERERRVREEGRTNSEATEG